MIERKVLKLNNKDDNFYSYMGKFFGSRVVQNKINDRIYDDANKEWYILLENKKSVGFISITDNTIKNIYAIKEEQLEYLLDKVKKDIKIKDSIVPLLYLDIYKKAGLIVLDEKKYKNFVIVKGKEG